MSFQLSLKTFDFLHTDRGTLLPHHHNIIIGPLNHNMRYSIEIYCGKLV